jgi:hypothetical protein
LVCLNKIKKLHTGCRIPFETVQLNTKSNLKNKWLPNKIYLNTTKHAIPDAKNFRFGIVVTEWNETITEGLFNGAYTALLENEVPVVVSLDGNVPKF